jgi:hypothetical protein
MSGTHIFYNGVELRDCTTETFTQKTVWDETKNAIYSHFRIRVSSSVFGFFNEDNPTDYNELVSHPSTVETQRTGINANDMRTAVDRMQIIHRLLSTPRKDFWYAIHNTRRADVEESVYQVLVASTGQDAKIDGDPQYFKDLFGNNVQIEYNTKDNQSLNIKREHCLDANNGPIPIEVSIQDIFSGNAFRISFEIEVHRILCKDVLDPDEDPPSWIDPDSELMKKNKYVLSNTWSSEETMDEQWRRVRVVEGTLRVRDTTAWGHAFRSLCLPGLLPGYKRASTRFASDPTNIVLKYRIEDRQAEAAPPLPAIDWKMVHTDSARNEYGQVNRQVTIDLVGPPRINRIALAGAALNVLDARFPGASKPVDDLARVKGINPVPFVRDALVVTQPSDAPTVSIMCNIRLTVDPVGGGAASFANAIMNSSTNLSIAGYNPERWPTPKPFDLDSPAGIFATYLQSPCSVWHGIAAIQRIDFGGPTLWNFDTAKNEAVILPSVGDNAAPKYWLESDYMEYASPTALTDAVPVTTPKHYTYPYTFVDIDNRYSTDHGMMVLPLSGKRPMGIHDSGPNAGQPNGLGPFRHTVAIPVHAGVTTRIITVNATREGRPPELPEPAEYLVDPNGVVEQLIDKSELILDAPKLSEGNSHRIFSGQMRLTYLLARPLASNERFRSANNPALVSSPGHNWVPGTAIFSKNRVEYHERLYNSGGIWMQESPLVYSPPEAGQPEVGHGFNEGTQTRPGYPGWENTLG